MIWPSSEALAQIMLSYPIEKKSILEIGCGMALPSLLLNKRSADITATDYHPEAKSFLFENLKLNKDPDIPFVRTDWKDINCDLKKFDMIIASDLLYQRSNPALLSSFINQHINSTGEIVIVDPGRENINNFIKEMRKLGFNVEKRDINFKTHVNKTFKGKELIFRKN